MEKKEHTPHDYSVDEILAETRGRFGGKTYAELIGEAEEPAVPERKPAAPAAPAQPSGELPRALSQVYPFDAPPVPTEQAAPAPVQPEKAPKSVPSKTQRPASQPENRPEPPRQEKPEDSGNSREDLPAEPPRGQEEPQKKKGFWARRREKKKKRQGFDETEDIYYGLQLKGLDEYRRGYNDDDAEQNGPTPAFSYLFDDTQDNDVDEEIAQRFAVIHQERQRRAEAAEFPPAGRRDAIYSYSDQALGAADRNPEARRPNDPIAFPTEEQRKKVLSRRTEIQPPEGRTVEFRMPDRLKAQQPLPRPEQKPQTESFDVDQILSERGFPTRKEMPQKENLDAPVPAPQTEKACYDAAAQGAARSTEGPARGAGKPPCRAGGFAPAAADGGCTPGSRACSHSTRFPGRAAGTGTPGNACRPGSAAGSTCRTRQGNAAGKGRAGSAARAGPGGGKTRAGAGCARRGAGKARGTRSGAKAHSAGACAGKDCRAAGGSSKGGTAQKNLGNDGRRPGIPAIRAARACARY